jgi:hypothetical protein
VTLSEAKTSSFESGLITTLLYVYRYDGVSSSDVNITSVSNETTVARRNLLQSTVTVSYTVDFVDKDYDTLMATLVSAVNSTVFTTILQQQTKLSNIVAVSLSITDRSPTAQPSYAPTMQPTSGVSDSEVAGTVIAIFVGVSFLISALMYLTLFSRKKVPAAGKYNYK